MLRLFALLSLVCMLAAPAGAQQQLPWWMGGVVPGVGAEPQTAPQGQIASLTPDYDAWARFAGAAEDLLENRDTSNAALAVLRADLVEWRERFLAAQNTNLNRIETIRGQLAALGPPPEGVSEPPEIAERRVELNDQLARLQAPGLAADEAHRRADGLIREIDRIVRARDADELLTSLPAPINPANWPTGWRAAQSALTELYDEMAEGLNDAQRRENQIRSLPMILAAAVLALFLIVRGRSYVQRLSHSLVEGRTERAREIVALFISLGQVVVPLIGVLGFCFAVLWADFLGPIGIDLFGTGVPAAAIGFFALLWLGGQVFPRSESMPTPLTLLAERRAEGRFHMTTLALLIAATQVAESVISTSRHGIGVTVLFFPGLVVAGLILFRLGQLLLLSSANETAASEEPGIRPLIMRLLGRAALAIGLAAPALAAVGYVQLGERLAYPALMTLGLFAILAILQRLVHNLYGYFLRLPEAEADEALVPTLVAFGLALSSIPLLAMVWGMRAADLLELWNSFSDGFRLGDTRIRPTDFFVFLAVFAVGYGLTRLTQAALRTSVLPKTKIDTGGQNAIVAGIGYVGLFFAALAAITSTGLDLSAFAIVAGALSVGIGFGLQNIVSNFVSGLILLIERPIAEGDWIQVGNVHGRVRAISVRSTRIETFDRTDVIVPNADLISGQVTNWTGFNLSGRLIVPVGVAYGSDTRKVERILREVGEAQPLVMLNPAPSVLFMGFGDSSLDFELRVILRDVNFMLAVRSEINHQIAQRFAEEGVEIPFPQRDLWLRNPERFPGGATAPTAGSAPPAPETSGKDPMQPDDLADDSATPNVENQG